MQEVKQCYTRVNPGGHFPGSDTMATWVIGLSTSAMSPEKRITVYKIKYIITLLYNRSQ